MAQVQFEWARYCCLIWIESNLCNKAVIVLFIIQFCMTIMLGNILTWRGFEAVDVACLAAEQKYMFEIKKNIL